jgi:demethylmenaquinone methyltransferase/2-methoxy-6-polyprenyl-1,4-benzoquinol methylase
VIVSISKDPARIAGMFDAIARRYDTLNHLLSVGLDRRWRRHAVRALSLTGCEHVLDVCTGTGDLAIEAASADAGHAAEVLGIDFSSEMLRHAAVKIREGGLASRVRIARADATAIPVADGSMDVATVAFGIRNVLDPVKTCAEFYRVLRLGGRLAVLEFGAPRIPGIRTAYLWYFKFVLPRVGRLVSSHREAYSYLPLSVLEFPTGEAFAEMLRTAGFSSVRYERLSFGIVFLYVATKDTRGVPIHPVPSHV